LKPLDFASIACLAATGDTTRPDRVVMEAWDVVGNEQHNEVVRWRFGKIGQSVQMGSNVTEDNCEREMDF